MSYPWADPQPAVGDLYGPITDALEHATDEYVAACNATAEAENNYARLFAAAYRQSEQVAVTARAKFCDQLEHVVEAKCVFNAAEARERACKAKVEEVRNRLMAAMSWQRMTSVGGL